MFTQKTIKIVSIIAICLSVIGLLLSIAGTILVQGAGIPFFMGCLSWAILTWASIIGFKLSAYKLYDDEYKKVGIRVYAIIFAFLLFFFVGIIAGLAISVILLSTLWGLKKNYDEWDYTDQVVDPKSPDDTNNNTPTI